MSFDVPQAYRVYRALNFDPLPIPATHNGQRSKGPSRFGWQERAAADDYTEADFQYPNTNIGVLLGGEKSKHLTDIDCDDPLAPRIAADILRARFTKLKMCVFGRKSNPGTHYLFHASESLRSIKITDPLSKKSLIEYRCLNPSEDKRGTQTMFPPSVHPDSGETVRFEDGCAPDSIPAVDAPLLYSTVELIAATILISKYFPEGDKHFTKRAWARVLSKGGVSLEDAKLIILTAYQHAPRRKDSRSAAKDIKDVREVFETLEADSEAELYGVPKLLESYDGKVVSKVLELLHANLPQSKPEYSLTDMGNGQRFADTYRDTARYCPEEKSWYIWNGKQWKKDTANQVQNLAASISDQIRQDAQNLKPKDGASPAELEELANTKDKMLKWANRSAMYPQMKAIPRVASSIAEIVTNKEQFDTHAHLLNCENGVVDLYTGLLMPHDRELFLSYLCPTAFTALSQSKDWTNVLEAVTRNHPDLPAFLQRFVGYIAQGNKGEELIAMCHGVGGTGKGTFWGVIQKTLGPDYARNVAAASLLRQDRGAGAATGDIARLEGCRLAIASEFERDSKLQDSFLKLVSGNDTIVARKLYQEEREFPPTFQLVFQSNHRPEFDSSDEANRRRYIEIPFDNVLKNDPKVTIDATLKKRLSDDKRVHEVCLQWIVAGSVEWHKNGLQIPNSVKAATTQLFKQNDVLSAFFAECIVVANGFQSGNVPVGTVKKVYQAHCRENDIDPMSPQKFNRAMTERGFHYQQTKIKKESVKVWSGLNLTEEGWALIESREDKIRRQYKERQEAKQNGGHLEENENEELQAV